MRSHVIYYVGGPNDGMRETRGGENAPTRSILARQLVPVGVALGRGLESGDTATALLTDVEYELREAGCDDHYRRVYVAIERDTLRRRA
jgi:hypothetical protein